MLHLGVYKDVFEQALFSLADNKLRSTLSILGIAANTFITFIWFVLSCEFQSMLPPLAV